MTPESVTIYQHHRRVRRKKTTEMRRNRFAFHQKKHTERSRKENSQRPLFVLCPIQIKRKELNNPTGPLGTVIGQPNEPLPFRSGHDFCTSRARRSCSSLVPWRTCILSLCLQLKKGSLTKITKGWNRLGFVLRPSSGYEYTYT